MRKLHLVAETTGGLVLWVTLWRYSARLYFKCEERSEETQFCFKKGLGTRVALFSMKLMLQNAYDQRKDVLICFIDYQKAFDTIRHDIRVIQNLYWDRRAEIWIGNSTTEEFQMWRGVRQECILSPECRYRSKGWRKLDYAKRWRVSYCLKKNISIGHWTKI